MASVVLRQNSPPREEGWFYIRGVERSWEESRTEPEGRLPVRAEKRRAVGPKRALAVGPLSSTDAYESEYETLHKTKGAVLPLFEDNSN